MIIKIVVLIIFALCLYKTLSIGSIFFNKDLTLTTEGHEALGMSLLGLIISGLQLFNVFDFVGYIINK